MLRVSRLGRPVRFFVIAALFAITAVVTAMPSQAKSPLSATVTVPEAVKRTCFARNVSGSAGVISRSVTAPVFGAVKVRLIAARGDWDLGVFDAKTGRTVAGSAHFGARELAESPVYKGEPLVVQACRISGNEEKARLSIGFEALPRHAPKAQLARVSIPTPEAKKKLLSLGLDLTEHGRKDFLEVVLYGTKDAEKLGKAGLISVTQIEDLAAQSRRDRRSEADWARRATATTTTFTNGNPIVIFDNGAGTANPYPSTIAVSGLSSIATDVNVSLNGLTHDFPDDVEVLLVGPTGQKVILQSDAGNGTALVPPVTLTFDDAAAADLPDEGALSTGTYRPSNYGPTDSCTEADPDAFPGPAPSGPYADSLSAFTGTNPNGTWSLYVQDDCQFFVPANSVSGGWSLHITTPPTAPPAVGLPSGRTGPYRRMMEYTSEMNALATNNPSIVKKLTLPLLSREGRPVEGLEITTNVNARDGKPVFFMMGLHHAREWPSGEHTIEWAYELVNGYNAGVPRVVNLMQTTRTIIVPMVNIDGFNDSREFGQNYQHGNGHTPIAGDDIILYLREYRRKNCRVYNPPAPELPPDCNANPSAGLGALGVDPNRNYGTFWGGPGSSSDPVNETFHGPHCTDETNPVNPVKAPNCGPFSEPDTENIRRLVSTRHVTTLITNHTFSNLVLRAPGLASQGLAPDETAMKALGDAMAGHNLYTSQYGWQLYDTTGTTEDWSYNTTGGYGYTFEIGPIAFHPPFQNTINEYDGTAAAGSGTLGNREAYFIAMENTANPVHHSRLTGSAPTGAVLRLKKVVQTPTSIRDTNNVFKSFTDTLDTTLLVSGGSYTWHINPSTRPLVVRERGRPANGSPSLPLSFSGTVAGPPADGAAPCANFTNPGVTCTNVHPFTVPAQVPGVIDNAVVAVNISWPTPGSDWDMKIFRDANTNGLVDAGDQQVGSSGSGTTAFEASSFSEPSPCGGPNPPCGPTPGQYLVQVINYAAAEPYNGTITFFGPDPFQPATTESWTFTCEIPEGTAVSTKQVTIARGAQQTHNFTAACALGPTGVELASFAARRVKSGVTVTWRTANERNIAGFNIWRAGKKLNRELIAAKRSGTVAGASYQLVDRSARAGVRYTYRLQAVTRDGSRSWLRQSTVRAKR